MWSRGVLSQVKEKLADSLVDSLASQGDGGFEHRVAMELANGLPEGGQPGPYAVEEVPSQDGQPTGKRKTANSEKKSVDEATQ